ncbi:MAG: phosphoglycolate phosphatase [Hyphomicrobiales bacterium]|nr:phosphoglycolate phosphatase [Hyphomicrobiales bacterium]
MPIRAILFDKDGTLVDFQRTWGPATHKVLTQLCNGDVAAFDRLASVSLYDPVERKLLPGSPVVIETTYGYGKLWAEALGVPLTAEFVDQIDRMFFQTTLDHLTPMGDVKGLLGALAARGLKLGLMTNDADANTRAQMRRLGLDSLLGFIAAYDSGFGAKPAPDPVLAFAAFAKVAPAEIAVVGDTAHDLVAARAAGSVAVGVLSGPIPREQLEPHADVLLLSIADLPDWLCSTGSKG